MKKINEIKLAELLNEIKNGNTSAFEELYVNYYKIVKAIAFSILKNNENSEDIAQNVFKKILTLSKEKFPTKGEASWLYAVTKNEALQSLRKKDVSLDIDEMYDLATENNEIEELLDCEKYNRIITSLDKIEKEIVSLKILSDFTFKEIGQILNIPMGTVQWKYYKSVYALKLLISNISMFILTISIYLTSKLNRNANKISEEKVGKEKNQAKDTQINLESTKNKNEVNIPESTENIVIEDNETSKNKINDVQQMTEQNLTNISFEKQQINFFEAGMIVASSMFLIFTIIFAIILKKHQQNRKQKASK